MLTHFAPLEADLARYYGLDLPDAIWGPAPLSARRLQALIRGLPTDALTIREAAPQALWGTAEELLAVIAEAVDAGNKQFFAANSPRGTQLPPPLRVPRPWENSPKAQASSEELAAWLTKAGGKVRYHPKGA